jgi:hypothetical protein
MIIVAASPSVDFTAAPRKDEENRSSKKKTSRDHLMF